MDRVMRNFSAMMAERRNQYLLAAIVIGFCVIVIVSFAGASKKSDSHQQDDIATTYKRCKDNGSVEVSSFKIENCKPGPQGHCLVRQGDDVEISVEFEPNKKLEKLAFVQERRKDDNWIIVGTGDPCKQGLKCPCEANTKQSLKNILRAWEYKENASGDFRLKLGQLSSDIYMCLEFTLDLDQ